MKDMYNIYGSYISNKTIEPFSDEIDYSERIVELSKQITSGEIKEDEIKDEISELKKLYKEGKFSEQDKKEFEELIKKNVRLSDGLSLVGNLEIGGLIKARGFHLADGSKLSTITKYKDKLAVPLDKDGNIHIKPKAGKKMKIDKTDINELNIPKSGKITFGAGEDNDPYQLQKIGNKDKNYLRLTLNDNKDESLQIWGNSCDGDKCKPDGGKLAHIFNSNGDAVHQGSLKITNPKNNNNPLGYSTHFNHNKQGLNYIRGKTEIRGEVNYVDTAKGINISNPKNGNNPIGWGTNFNYQGSGANYIRGRTEIRGPSVNIITDSGVTVSSKGKVASFGSQNSSWCHLITNAPQFYMNKSLQVNGAISSYSNKPLNANRGVNAPHYSRIGGDWLRINPEGNSAGRVAVYGGFSINDVRGGKAGLGVGYWGYPGRGNIKATGTIEAKTIKAKNIEIGNWKISESNDRLVFTNKENNRKILQLLQDGGITVGTNGRRNGNSLNNTLYWCGTSQYKC